MTKSLIVSIFLCFCFYTVAQKYSFVTYSTEEGLPQSQVTSITQDDKGYLWVGTLGGLAKFNGDEFVVYTSNNGLLNHRITALEFFDNTLWVGHDDGISFIKNQKISHVDFRGSESDRSRNVSKILEFNEKVLVCSRDGLFEYKDSELQKITLKEEDYNIIRSAYVYDGKIYLATKGGVLSSSDAKRFELLEEFGRETFSGVTGKGDKIVFSTYNEGVFIKDMVTQKTDHYTSEQLKHSIFGCYIDNVGKVWMHTLDGIVKIGNDKKVEFFDDANGLPVNMISCIFNDDAQNIWIGSQGKGLFRFPSNDFRYFDQSTGLPSDLFTTGFQDRFGDYYLGTFDKGIVKKSKSGELSSLNVSENTIWTSVKNVNGKHWFGTGSSLVEYDPVTGKLKEHTSEHSHIPGFKITGLFKVSDNTMYIGGNGGVSKYEHGEFIPLGEDDSDIGTVRDFEVVNEVLYCVTNLGLYEYRDGRFSMIPGTEKVAYAIEKDDDGLLWFGTEEGLYKLENGKPVQVKLSNDASSNFITLLNFKDGKLYVGTTNGLFVVSNLFKSVPDVLRYGTGDGIIDLETNLNSGFFDRRGDFWFGTASGIVCYHRNSGVSVGEKPVPRVNMTSILLNYEKFSYGSYSDTLNSEGFPLNLNLPYAKNNLIFELDGVSLVHQEKLSYQFMLEGLREEWSLPSDNSTITFTSLPAGEYVLHVRAVDVDGRLSEELNFPFVINPAFYETWWFILICSMILAGILILIFRYRINRLAEVNQRQRLEYKSRLLALEQKSMNASMNRHFIFNSLNSIQYFINTQDRLSANKYLTNFAKLIRKNLDSVTAEGNLVSMAEEMERLELYLSLESMRFKDRFDYVINTGGFDLESILIPPMMMQPFIENSIIHGILPNEEKKGLISINLKADDNDLIIEIRDNGIGIKKSLSQKSMLDGDHRSQGMEITSKRIEILQKISGNNISLIGPEEVMDSNGSINGTHVLIKIPLSNLEF